MPAYCANIEEATLNNINFRQVLFTGKHCQLVVMCLQPMEEIGFEIHENVDQFFRIESGMGQAIVDGQEYDLTDGTALLVVAGSNHNVKNVSDTRELKLYTIYSPANHPDGTIHINKAEAEEYEKSHH